MSRPGSMLTPSHTSVEEIGRMRELVSRAKANVDGMMSQLKMIPLSEPKSRDMFTRWFEATSTDLKNLDEFVSSSFWIPPHSSSTNYQLNGNNHATTSSNAGLNSGDSTISTTVRASNNTSNNNQFSSIDFIDYSKFNCDNNVCR